ncbi:hypothetical protein C1I95_21195 [Micromonospora craterilacus]|uniref:DUF6879 domain-containing protein n=1 Tax=Micromonospora craterilacus TaxID=1655439 RepID=A0A2W2ECR4_9ACTN|nr:DUF6879 family protein [Micromonospora craterilacus]PZG14699.1 hypothetical protein C1I95_21195 [Micromonospora craterilacus]
MRDLLRASSAQRLNLPDYEADFYAAVESVDGPILKTERMQSFREPGSPSWEAFAAGRWKEALRIAAEPNPELERFFAHLDELGSGLHRLRIVELPLTPYLHWELNFLRYRAEAGEHIRVLNADANAVVKLEYEHGVVPELMVAGSQAVYEVRYDEAGAPVGADKFVAPEVVEGCRSRVTSLLADAEAFESFFRREVDGLKPPEGHV